MASKTKQSKKTSKRRLALPISWVKNLEEAGRNLKAYRGKGAKEVERIYNKVIEIDFVKKARKHDVVRKATQASTRLSKEVEQQVKKIRKEFELVPRFVRQFLPIPSRTEIENLTRKVNELAKKLDELNELRTETTVTTPKRSVSSL